jgi:hypothetical protein
VERPPGALVRPIRLKSICLNQATRFTIQDLEVWQLCKIDGQWKILSVVWTIDSHSYRQSQTQPGSAVTPRVDRAGEAPLN